jgi:AcrR family transcriptional regulator
MINQVKDPNDTRSRLIVSAMQLFWEKGYNSTSIADVLQTAKVNSGSLYHFFPGKSDLLAAVLDMYYEGIRPMLLEPAWTGVDDPVERIFALLSRYRRSLVETECFYGCPIGSLALELHEPDEPVRRLLIKNFSAWIDAIEECLQATELPLLGDGERRDLARFVLTTMEGAVMQARTFRDISYFDASVRQLRRHFDRLQGEPSSRGPGKRVTARSAKNRS